MSWGQAFIKTCENYTRLHSCFKPRPPAGSCGRCPLHTYCHPQYLNQGLRPFLTRIFPRILQRVGSGDNPIFKSSVCSAFAYFNSKFIKWMTGLEPAPVSLSVRSSIQLSYILAFFEWLVLRWGGCTCIHTTFWVASGPAPPWCSTCNRLLICTFTF